MVIMKLKMTKRRNSKFGEPSVATLHIVAMILTSLVFCLAAFLSLTFLEVHPFGHVMNIETIPGI